MLKSISKLGTVLSKLEQKAINGGQISCPDGQVLHCVTLSPGYTRCVCSMKVKGDDPNS